MFENVFGYNRSYSLTQTLLELNLPSFDTVLVNSRVRFLQRWKNCDNAIVKHLDILSLSLVCCPVFSLGCVFVFFMFPLLSVQCVLCCIVLYCIVCVVCYGPSCLK